MRKCEPNEFQCRNGQCVQKMWVCDREDDCGDNSDEADCGKCLQIRKKYLIFRQLQLSAVLSITLLFILGTPAPGQMCGPRDFECHSGHQCIPRGYQCDGQNDCQDGSDEHGCCKYLMFKLKTVIYLYF